MPPKRKATAPASSSSAKPPSTAAKPASKRATRSKGKKPVVDPASDEDKDDAPPPSKRTKVAGEDAADSKDDAKDDTGSGASEKKKMVTVLKRGLVPVDHTSQYVNTHQVYYDGTVVWDASLNQTDIVGKNSNKYYILQLLHPIGNNANCILFLRWGRVGEDGANQTKGPWPSSIAINEFKKQFRAKTGSPWELRTTMQAKKGKYVWIEKSLDDEEEEKGEGSSKPKSSKGKEIEKLPDSRLSPELQSFCKIIFSTSLFDAALSAMNYDANKLPLGKLAKSTILNGFAALKAIAEVIEDPTNATAYGNRQRAFEELTGRYYSVIPHVFGRNRPTVIDNMPLLKKELELVDALGDMEVANTIISQTIPKDAQGNPVNELDAQFLSLGLETMDAVARDTKEFGALLDYVQNSHGQTHHFNIKLESAFRVTRPGESERFVTGGYDKLPTGERLLLWHGSRASNFAGILKQGLRIAPPEAPVSGYMFGKGVYFADIVSKSAGYTHYYLSDNTGILLLCEVAAKPFYELTGANYNASAECKQNGKLTTKGIGITQPVDWQDAGEALENGALKGCWMPKGQPKDERTNVGYLQYNEYIAYDTAQIKVRYLLMTKIGN